MLTLLWDYLNHIMILESLYLCLNSDDRDMSDTNVNTQVSLA